MITARFATINDIPVMRKLAQPLHASMDADTAMGMIVTPVSLKQALIFCDNGVPVSYATFAKMGPEAERKYVNDGEVDFKTTGDHIWTIEFAGTRVREAQAIFANMLRAGGEKEYRFFRETDQRVHTVRV